MDREDIYIKNRIIEYSDLDKSGCLDFFKIPMLFQDVQTEYFGSMGTSNDILKEKDNAGWVLTKAAIHVNRLPFWQTKLTMSIYCTKVDAIRVTVEMKTSDEEGNISFTGMAENCAIDLASRRIRRISSVTFPQDVSVYESCMKSKFEKLHREFDHSEQVDELRVHWADIDFTNHTNNASYVRYMQHTLGSDFLIGKTFTDMELHYINESRQGDNLDIFRVEDSNFLEFLIKNAEAEIVRSRVKFRAEEC